MCQSGALILPASQLQLGVASPRVVGKPALAALIKAYFDQVHAEEGGGEVVNFMVGGDNALIVGRRLGVQLTAGCGLPSCTNALCAVGRGRPCEGLSAAACMAAPCGSALADQLVLVETAREAAAVALREAQGLAARPPVVKLCVSEEVSESRAPLCPGRCHR